jgi:pimeloyl-ACP methyl ester carboxylesterase
MATFVLVHGAWHGAWCWAEVVPVLRARGHAAIAVDLPAGDPQAGCAAYAKVVGEDIDGLGEDVVLVGHSLGGLTIPLVAAGRPVRRLVFLCALIPQPGASLSEQLRAEPGIFAPGFRGAPARDAAGCSWWPDREEAIATFYADCPRELAQAAAERLRPQSSLPSTERCPLASLPPVACSYILTREDAAISPEWSRRAAPERLGTTALELAGGHSPFFARPAELAETLIAACG